MAHEAEWGPVLDSLVEALDETGGYGWLVGGCLRDALLSEPVGDVDVALTVEPLPMAERLVARLPLGIGRLGHGTIRLSLHNTPEAYLDLTPLQGDDIVSDLAGRDFTVNAMALPLTLRAQWLAVMSGQGDTMPSLLDPFGGVADLTARRLVTVGSETFRADPGRIIRAARLLARFGLHPDEGTLRLARGAVPLLVALSPDRLRSEMAPLLALPAATDGVALLQEMGALAALYLGLTGDAAAHALATLRQLDRLIGVVDAAPAYFALREWGASDARRIALRRMALAHAEDDHAGIQAPEPFWRRALALLVMEDETARFHEARVLFDRSAKDVAAAADALLVAAACALAIGEADAETLAARADALVAIYLSDRERLIPPPLLKGSDLIAALGAPPGPEIGRLLREVRLAQLLGAVNDRDDALAFARQLFQAQ